MNLFGAHACRSCCDSWPGYLVRHTGIPPGLYIHEITYKGTNTGTFNQTGITAPSVYNQGCCYLDDWNEQDMGCDRYPEVTVGKHYLFYDEAESYGNLYKYKTIPVPQNNHISGDMTIEDLGVSTVYHQSLHVHKINEINFYQSGRSVQFRFSPGISGKSYTYSVMGVKSLNGIPSVDGDKIIYYRSGENDLFPGQVDRNEDVYINLKGGLTETSNTFRSGSVGRTTDLMVRSVVSPRCGVPYVTGISGNNNGFLIPRFPVLNVSGQWSEAFDVLPSDEGDVIEYFHSNQSYCPTHFYNDESSTTTCTSYQLPFTLWNPSTNSCVLNNQDGTYNNIYNLENVGIIDGPFPAETGNYNIENIPGYTGGFNTSLFGQATTFYDVNKSIVSGQERINYVDLYHLGLNLAYGQGQFDLFPSYEHTITQGSLNTNDRPPFTTYYRSRFSPTGNPVISYYQQAVTPTLGERTQLPIKAFRASDFPNGHVFCPWEGTYDCETQWGGTLTLQELELTNDSNGISSYTQLNGNYYSDIYCSGDIP